MEYSQKFGFNLPSSDTDDLVDVNLLSDNFIILDYKALSEDDVKQKFDAKSEAPQSGIALAETFANVIKQTKSGAVVFANDVSPIEHNLGVKLSSDTITDFSSVKVTRCGKNLFDGSIKKGFTLSGTGNNRTVASDNSSGYKIIKVKPNTTYTISGDFSVVKDYTMRMASFTEYPTLNSVSNKFVYQTNIAFSFSTTSNDSYLFIWIVAPQKTTDIAIQIEESTTATEYEPYNPYTVTANADGSVDLTSISPNMTLFSDTDGMDISVNYNADTKKYIDNKFAELQALILEG